MEKETGKVFAKNILCFLVLVLCSFAVSYPFFNDGETTGDDSWFHLTQIQDIYYGMRNGFWGLSPNHVSLGTLGIYVYQYYGPFPHYASAFLLYLFNSIGMDAISAMKTLTFISVLLSSFFSFGLGKKITGNDLGGMIGGVAYIFHPYRIFSTFRREAFAEVIAMAFIPFIFYGLYSLLNDKKTHFLPYIALIIGVSLIILSHPFTALITVLFGLTYLVFNFQKVFYFVKNWKKDLIALASILLIIGSVAFYVFPLMKAEGEGLHRINDPVIMLTNVSQLSTTSNSSFFFSGLLDYSFIYYFLYYGQWNPAEGLVNYDQSLIFLFASLFVTLVVDTILEVFGQSKKARLWIDFSVLFIVSNFVHQPLEFLISLFVFYVIFAIYKVDGGKSSLCVGEKERPRDVFKEMDIYYSIMSLIVLGLLIFGSSIWYYVPDFMLKGQFSWRLWSMFDFLVIFLALLLIKYFKKVPFVNSVAIGSVAFLIAAGQGLPLARNIYQFQRDQENTITWNMNDERLKEVWYVGVQSEYLPKVFRYDSYVSSYRNSLYSRVKSMSQGLDISYDLQSYITPVFLQGTGTLEMTEVKSPEVRFNIEVSSEDSLIQIPQFYYDGYVATLKDNRGHEHRASGIYIDGLVSFEIPQGEYDVSITFEGNGMYKIGLIALALSLVGIGALSIMGCSVFVQRKRGGKDINI